MAKANKQRKNRTQKNPAIKDCSAMRMCCVYQTNDDELYGNGSRGNSIKIAASQIDTN